MRPKLKLIQSGKDVTMNSILLEHRMQVKKKSQFDQISRKNNVSKANVNVEEESTDLVHTMMSVMTALQILNQKNLNGIEVMPSEWEGLGTAVSKLTDLLQSKTDVNT